MAPGCDAVAAEPLGPFVANGMLRKDKWKDLLKRFQKSHGAISHPDDGPAENGTSADLLKKDITAAAQALDVSRITEDLSGSEIVLKDTALAYLQAAPKDTDRVSVAWAAVLLFKELGQAEEMILAGLNLLGQALVFDAGAVRRDKLTQIATCVNIALADHLRANPCRILIQSTAAQPAFLALILWSWDIAFTLFAKHGPARARQWLLCLDAIVLHECGAELLDASDAVEMNKVVESFAAALRSEKCSDLVQKAHASFSKIIANDADIGLDVDLQLENGQAGGEYGVKPSSATTSTSDTMYSAVENEDDAMLESFEVVHLDIAKVDVRNELPDGSFIDIPSRLLLTNYRLILQRKRCCCEGLADGDDNGNAGRNDTCSLCKIDMRYADSPYKAIGCYTRVGGEVLEVPVYSIRRIDEVSADEVVLIRNNMHRLRISFPPLSMPGFRNLCKPLCNAAVADTFAFQLDLSTQTLTVPLTEQWRRFSPAMDFERMRMGEGRRFRVLDQTESYAFCPTYPRVLHVASSLTDEQLKSASEFRIRRRIPVAVWRHERNGAILARCAQPMVGLRNSRSKEDEMLVCELLTGRTLQELTEMDVDVEEEAEEGTGQEANGMDVNWVSGMISTFTTFTPFDSRQKEGAYASMMSREEEDRRLAKFGFYIVDARSKIASYGNRAMGRGTENPVNYKGAHLLFMAIDNIQRVQASFDRLVEVVQPSFSEDSLAKAIGDSGWLAQVKSIMNASVRIVHVVERHGRSVLTHCSDGWDRTAQIVSLAQLLLDPFYRTSLGFSVLVEKEWCSFGHKFKDRYDHGNQGSTEFSPVFWLWLDCVWQVMRQFPHALEFNENFLITLADHVDSGRFGNFLMNCEKERKEARVEELTESIWPLLNGQQRFKNTGYKQVNCALYPGCLAKNIRLWEAFYFRYDPTMTCD